jgi:thymidylate synthase (FAD)
MKVELIDYMGDDNRVADSARVSFSKEASNYTEEQNEKLIKFLARNGHFTPFTHPQITVRETVPIFVARQRFKSTVGFTYNEVSRRYVDDTPEFFTPDVWRKRPDGSVKQGSGDGVITHFGKSYIWDYNQDFKPDDPINEAYKYFLSHAEFLYNSMIEAGVAPEQARMVLPQSMYTSYYVTGSLSAFARAYKLRADAHAQKEIQDLAAQWDEIISPLFPHSWKALTE